MRAIPNSRALRKAVRALEKAQAAGLDKYVICDVVGRRRYDRILKLARVEDIYLSSALEQMVRDALRPKVEPLADGELPF